MMQRPDYTTQSNEALVDLVRSTSDDSMRKRYLTALYQNNYLYFLKICRRYSGYEDIDDLMQEAFIGLRLAVDKYDPEKEIPFIAFSAYVIIAEICRYLEKSGGSVRIPSYVRTQISKYNEVKKAFVMKCGRDPSARELRALLSWSDDQLKRVEAAILVSKATSLDMVVSEDDDSVTLMDMVADPADHYSEVNDRIDDERKRMTLWEEVDKLTDTESKILREYYINKKTLDAIGQDLGCAGSRVQQIRNKALKKLQKSGRIKRYADEYTTARAFFGTGLYSFIYSGLSAPERVAIHNIERTISANQREAGRKYRKGRHEADT